MRRRRGCVHPTQTGDPLIDFMVNELGGTVTAFTCPICEGQAETEREARIMRDGLNWWIEYGCRACNASGKTTPERLADYHENRKRDAREAWEREQRRREAVERE